MNPETIQINIGFIEGIIGIIAVVVSIGIAWGKLNLKVDNIADDIDEINKKIGKIENKIEKVENRIGKIETKLSDHGESIASINATFNAFGIHGSPMKPSEKGEKLLKERTRQFTI